MTRKDKLTIEAFMAIVNVYIAQWTGKTADSITGYAYERDHFVGDSPIGTAARAIRNAGYSGPQA